MNSAEVIAGVGKGCLDVGFIETPDAPDHLRSVVVARDELLLIVDPAHRWARRRRPIQLEELAATPLVVREPGSGTRRTVEDLLAPGPTAPPVMELSSTGAIVHSVVAGSGPAVVSSLAVKAASRAGLVAIVPLEGVRLRRDLLAIWRGARLEAPAGDFVLQAQGHAHGRVRTRRS
ncbi:MAG: LysR substrate-binding domain-containing protein, partial [Micrococcales bacterium]|nr:LysR substrate-binding domain-containing protein [Micrococcales bacterium]